MARRATRISQERAKGGNLLVLDSGDSLTGDQDPARKTQGKSSVTAMNKMGYDAMVLGPQDLALGPSVLAQRMAESKFEVLSANTVISATGQPLAKPYIIREMSGYRVAIVGLSGGSSTAEIAVQDPLQAAAALIPQLAGKADVVILLSHAGITNDQWIAQKVSGISLIVSGGPWGVNVPWRSDQTGTIIVHADEASPGHAGRRLGIGTFTFGKGRVDKQNWQRVELLPEVPDDPAMAAWLLQGAP